MNVAYHRRQIFIGIDENALIAAPKQCPIPPMAPVESLSVDTVNMAHDPGEVSFRSSQTQMVVISHQTIGKHLDSPLPMGFGQGIEKSSIVSVVDKCRLSCPTPVHYVIDSPGILNSERPRHVVDATSEGYN